MGTHPLYILALSLALEVSGESVKKQPKMLLESRSRWMLRIQVSQYVMQVLASVPVICAMILHRIAKNARVKQSNIALNSAKSSTGQFTSEFAQEEKVEEIVLAIQ